MEKLDFIGYQVLGKEKVGVKELERQKPDESEHVVWKGGIKVLCGRLIPSGYKDSPLEYNNYAAYDSKHV